MTNITANELKTKGISIVESTLQNNEEAVITVRGEQKYVVVDFKTYNKFREYELDIAIHEAHNDIAKKNYKTETVDEHMKRVLG